METSITITDVQLSYPNLFKARAVDQGQTPKFSSVLIVDKKSPAIAQIKKINQAIIQNKWGDKDVQLKPLAMHDGEAKHPGDPQYKGKVLISASNTRKPGLVDRSVQPIIEEDAVYPGVYANVSLNLYPYDHRTAKGVAFGLQAVQIVRDGDRLDGGGGEAAASAFSPIEDEDFMS